MPEQASAGLDRSLGCLIDPVMNDLAAQLGSVPGLDADEVRVICAGTRGQVTGAALRKVSRILLLELNGARISGRLRAPDPHGRWQEWLSGTTTLNFWESLSAHYPTLLPRLQAVIRNNCSAALAMGTRFAADRQALTCLPGAGCGRLMEVTFGAGDSHNHGQTVALLRTTDGQVVYKPRSVAIDACLAGLLRCVTSRCPGARAPIRVPDVLNRDTYGWAEHVGHRYCADDSELRAFYQGIGHWLAVMRLVGGSDLHAENVIACGPVPVVVDCETLFAPYPAPIPTGYGRAHDTAARLVSDSALRTGLLPGRGDALAWRGIDSSAVGSLPGQQPTISVPVIIGEGTDEARVGYERQRIPAARNHPSPEPVLATYWREVLDGFTAMTATLRELDKSGETAALLAPFADCPVRVLARNTETYMELTRMLWHPVSMHDQPAAVQRAAELLALHAAKASVAPADPAVIDAEIAEMLEGDVPVFVTTPRTGRLAGPHGTAYGEYSDLAADALRRWREIDHDLDLQVVAGTLVSAYLNEGVLPDFRPVGATRVSATGLDRRRRAVAASIMRTMRDAAIRADDGTATWIAPVISPVGWAIQPLTADLYNGLSGTAIAIAAYQREVSAGRADPVGGLAELLDDTLRSLRSVQDQDERDRRGPMRVRPDLPGGYVGLGSLIWAWLLLDRMGVPEVSEPDALAHALAAAGQLAEAIGEDDSFDLFRGMAGAIVPLLRLSERTGDPQWAGLAGDIGTRLGRLARTDSAGARWCSPTYPDGLGGMAHGSTGIGWALSRLSAHPAVRRDAGRGKVFSETAAAAFGFEDSLYDEVTGSWTDLREPGHITAAWCHGAVGIGIAAADLAARGGGERWLEVLRRAACCSWQHGLGMNHTLCHGDLGVWEIMDTALAASAGPDGLDRAGLDARIVSGLGEHGPVSGLARDTLSPALMSGIGGIAYQLLRMDRRSPLPSVLLPDPGPAGRLDSGPS